MKHGLVIAMMIAAPASAQTGSRSVISTSTAVTNVRPYEELRAFGACIASSKRQGALALIATEPGSRKELAELRKTVYGEREDECLWDGTKMTFSDVYARGVVAEGLLRFGVPETHRLAAPASTEVVDLHDAARCYANGHREQVRALLATKMGSAEETKAIAALWSDFRGCVGTIKARLNGPWVRVLLAEALLRLPPEPTAAGE